MIAVLVTFHRQGCAQHTPHVQDTSTLSQLRSQAKESPIALPKTMVRIAATLMLAASTKALTRGAFNRLTPTALLGSLLGANGDKYAGAVMGTEDIMKPKAHGTRVQRSKKRRLPPAGAAMASIQRRALLDAVAAPPSPPRRRRDAIAASRERRLTRTPRRHVRHARPEGPAVELRRADRGSHLQFQPALRRVRGLLGADVLPEGGVRGVGRDFVYDSNTGNELFTAPKGRSFEQFVKESRVSRAVVPRRRGQLGLRQACYRTARPRPSTARTSAWPPDKNGNQYCINLVSVAGRPKKAAAA